eukprot:11502587-Heterocapsa_arctica.AAC.1
MIFIFSGLNELAKHRHEHTTRKNIIHTQICDVLELLERVLDQMLVEQGDVLLSVAAREARQARSHAHPFQDAVAAGEVQPALDLVAVGELLDEGFASADANKRMKWQHRREQRHTHTAS